MSSPILASIAALHVPDGFLTVPISAIAWVLTMVAVGLALRNAQTRFDERLVPLAGIMAAFIFAGQMINFPVAGGTSGHLVGATLAVILLGPWLGLLVMAAVVGLQALLFQDGGLVVMGANILIMGVVPAFVGFGIYRLAAKRTRNVVLGVSGLAAWLSVLAAAFVTALLLWLSGTSGLRVVMPAMLGVHVLIGIGEALITIAALAFVLQTRPDLMRRGAASGGRGWIFGGLAITLAVLALAPLASAAPDGLERVAEDIGFIEAAQDAPYEVLPDYVIPALGETALSTVLAGLVGVVVVAAIVVLVARALRRQRA
jgi:cobalt/nickel transport system permease protein